MGKREDVIRVREAAEACLRSWLIGDEKVEAIHSDCQLMWIDDDSTLQILTNDGTIDWKSLLGTETVDVFETSVLTTMIKCVSLLETAAAVRVCIPFSAKTVSGWLVYLRSNNETWQCISSALSVGNSDEGEGESYQEYRKIRELVWGRIVDIYDDDDENNDPASEDALLCYRLANRECDGSKMERVLHASAFRLTEVDKATAKVHIIDRNTFCNQLVAQRYDATANSDHCNAIDFDTYAASYDEILSGEFATPSIAVVKCKIGHPPALWTDFLTCAKVDERWCIVQKSSCRQPFPETK